jgi:nitrite reductase/ring-hydroxylating ferredoxin subunit
VKPLCSTADIPEGGARGFDKDAQQYIVVREQQSFYVYRNRCPHMGVALNWLPDDFVDPHSDLLRCAMHGALFLPETGECVAGPCSGQFLNRVPFSIQGDHIVLDAESNENGERSLERNLFWR